MSKARAARKPKRISPSGVAKGGGKSGGHSAGKTLAEKPSPRAEDRRLPANAATLRSLVSQAMDALRLAGDPGNKSSAWLIPEATLWQMCCARIIELRPVEEILGSYAEEIAEAGVDPRNVRRFIQRVRERADDLQHKAWQRIGQSTKLQGMSGDPNALAMVVVESAAQDIMASIQAGELKDGTVSERHALLRSCEMLVNACERFATTKFKLAQAAKVEQQVRDLADRLDGEIKKGTTTISIKQIADEVRAVAGGSPRA